MFHGLETSQVLKAILDPNSIGENVFDLGQCRDENCVRAVTAAVIESGRFDTYQFSEMMGQRLVFCVEKRDVWLPNITDFVDLLKTSSVKDAVVCVYGDYLGIQPEMFALLEDDVHVGTIEFHTLNHSETAGPAVFLMRTAMDVGKCKVLRLRVISAKQPLWRASFINLLGANTYLKELSIPTIPLSDEQLHCLGGAMHRNKTLETLVVCYGGKTMDPVMAFLRVVSFLNKTLLDLEIEWAKPDDTRVRISNSMSDALKQLISANVLHRLVLHDFLLQHARPAEVMKALCSNTSLEHVAFCPRTLKTRPRIPTFNAMLVEVLEANKSLRVFAHWFIDPNEESSERVDEAIRKRGNILVIDHCI